MIAVHFPRVMKVFMKLASVVSVLLTMAIFLRPKGNYMQVVTVTNGHEVLLSADHDLVPNIVHFIRFKSKNLTFIEAVCILAALKNQKPESLIIHTDDHYFEETGGKYWKIIKKHPLSAVIQIQYLPLPSKIFHFKFNPSFKLFHASDVERLKILKKYGGIYLDGDSYVVQSLNTFRKYEMVLGWEPGGGISDQVIVAAKNARFLDVWLDSYHDYRADSWFYNGGELPTELLKKQLYLVHTVPQGFAEWKTIPKMLYTENSDRWKRHYAIHLLIRHQYLVKTNLSDIATYPIEFNETNILNYPAAIRQMAVDVYPYSWNDTKIQQVGRVL